MTDLDKFLSGYAQMVDKWTGREPSMPLADATKFVNLAKDYRTELEIILNAPESADGSFNAKRVAWIKARIRAALAQPVQDPCGKE